MKKIFSFIAILSLLLTSCEGFDMGSIGKVEDLFSQADLSKLDGFKAEGGFVKLPFTAKYDWEAETRSSWIDVSPKSGYAGEEVNLRIELEENTSTSERNGVVNIKMSNGTNYDIPVRQLGAEKVEEPSVLELVDGAYYEIDAEGGELEVMINTNVDEYDIFIPKSGREWLSHTDTRAMRSETIVFTATKNEENVSRETTVTLSYGKEEIEFVIYQEAAPQGGNEDETVLELVEGENYYINPDGGDIDIKVRSNVAYTVEVPADAAWLHQVTSRAAVTESIVTLYADKNDSGVKRIANVTLKYSDSVAVSFFVTQEAAQQGGEEEKATIDVSPKVINLGADGGSQNISVTSNAQWSVSCTEPGVSIYPTSGKGNGTVAISIGNTTGKRTFYIDFAATLGDSTAKASVSVSQDANATEMTPGEHQQYLEQVGLRLLSYFNPEDSRALATSVNDLANAGGLDFYLEEPTRSVNSASGVKFAKALATNIMGLTRFSASSAVRLSTTVILPWEDGTYSLDEYKGKQYLFNYATGKWKESSLGNVNKIVAIWGTSVATLTWEEGTSSWEGFINLEDKAKAENIPSAINLAITVDGNTELTTAINIQVPTNYSIETQTVVWLKGDYNFSVVAKADRKGVEGSVVVSKRNEKLLSGGGKVAINDLTDSKNWFTEYTDEWFDGFEWHYDTYTWLNYEYAIDQVKTGSAYATVLDVALQAEGNLRTIIDEFKKIEDYDSTKEQAEQLSNIINANASALLYYTGNNEKIADVIAEASAYKRWYWDENTGTEGEKLYYDPMPVLVFTDGVKYAIDEYFTEQGFGSLIEAAEELLDKYIGLVD